MGNIRLFTQNLKQIRTLPFPKKTKTRILIITFAMAVSGLLDLVGVALIGLISILTANAATSIDPKPDGRVQRILELSHLENTSELNRILIISLLTLLIFLTKTLLSVFFLRKLYSILGQVSNNLSRSVLNKLMRSDLITIKAQDSQSYLFIVTSGTDAVAFGLIASMSGILTDVTLLLAMFSALLYIDLKVALLSTVFFVLLGYTLTKLLSSENRRIGKERVRTSIEFSNVFLESMGTIREWRARNREDYVLGRVTKVREEQAINSAKSAFLPNVSKFVLEGSVVLGIFLLSASQALSDDKTKTAAVLAIFITAGVRVVPSVLRIQQNFMNYESAQEVSTPLFTLVGRLPEIQGDSEQSSSDIFSQNSNPLTKVSHLDFSYDELGPGILNDVSFEIDHGMFVALVGKSGSGKSTLVDCLLGLISPSSGSIIFGGVPIKLAQSINPNYFSYVPQEIFLVNGSLRDNLTWGIEPDSYSSSDLWKCIEQVGLGHFFEPRGGLNFEVAERGANLSGGQRQRIGIARALVTKPKFLVLDEATSSLDADSESVVSSLLLDLKNYCTVLVIAHRIETLKSADKVLRLEDGSLVILDNLEHYFNDNSALQDDLGLSVEKP